MGVVHGGVRSLLWIISIVIGFAIEPAKANDQSPKLCLHAPIPVEFTYVFFPIDGDEYVAGGWWRLFPGDCVSLKPSQSRDYYFYAKSTGDDYISRETNTTELHWLSNSREAWRVCLPLAHQRRELDKRPARLCGLNEQRYPLLKHTYTDSNDAYFLTLGERLERKLSFENVSFSETREFTERLKKQIAYGNQLEVEGPGAPYRIGLITEQTKAGLIVKEIVPSMPAEGVFLPGDKIISVAGEKIQTQLDWLYALQNLGFNYRPNERRGEIQIARQVVPGIFQTGSLQLGPCGYENVVCLAHFAFLDPRYHQNLSQALLRGVTTGIFWGFDGEFYCGFKRVVSNWTDTDQKICIKALKDEREEFFETHPDLMALGDLAGSMTSPRLVWHALAKKSGKKTIRHIAVSSADEAWQGGFSYFGKLSDREAAELNEVLIDIGIGAALGATVGVVTKD